MAGQEKIKLIAIVDDDDSVRSALHGMLKAVGLPSQAFASAEEFLKSGQQYQTGCLITDIRMPGISGLELQARLKQQECNVPIIFITAFDDAEIRAQAIKEGAVEFLVKPFDHQLLLKMLRGTLDRWTCGVSSPHRCECVQTLAQSQGSGGSLSPYA